MSERLDLIALRHRAQGGGVVLDRDIYDIVDALTDMAYALEELLSVAERMRGGDTTLDPEEWYAARDYARIQLGRFDFKDVA